jgi:hypothetical protein
MAQITIDGVTDVIESLKGLGPQALILLKRRISTASSLLREQIVNSLAGGTYGIRSKSGRLSTTVQELDVDDDGDSVATGGVVGGGPSAEYGNMFEEGGNGPYEIVAKPGSVLAWPGKKNQLPHGLKHRDTPEHRIKRRAAASTAGAIFAKRVHHPAMKQAKWFTGPADDLVEAIQDILNPTEEMDLEG